MTAISKGCFVPLIVPLIFAAAFAQHQDQAGPAASESGAALFRRHCGSCHGRGGEGGRAPSLTGRLHAGDTDADMARVIAGGIAGTDMLAYAARLGDEKIARIVAYLRSVKREEPSMAGDSVRGQAIFWGKGACASCHAIGPRGNRLGPDLSIIGRQRSAGFLLESLLKPAADVGRGYLPAKVVTLDGKTVRGIERSFDEFSVVLQDFSGTVHSFDRRSLKFAEREHGGSLMPSYEKLLTVVELEDLVKFLASLGRAQ
jgi:cytochrome c oxidase cbb3-type subunit III